MDTADFLQDVATAEGRKFTKLPIKPSSLFSSLPSSSSLAVNNPPDLSTSEIELTAPHSMDSSQMMTTTSTKIPIGSKQLSEAWQSSSLYKEMLFTIENDLKLFHTQQSSSSPSPSSQFSPQYLERYPESFIFYFQQLFSRQLKLTFRDHLLLKARIFRYLILGSVTSSLFHNLSLQDIHTMSGFIFYSTLTLGVGNLTLIPTLYLQKLIYSKQSISLFYPTSSYVLSQTLILIPLQGIDILIFCSMTYWSVGLTNDWYGIKFFYYLLIMFLYYINFAQFIRLLCSIISIETLASPSIGILLMFMVLVSGYVIPLNMIPNWLLWLYWSNPFSWTMRALAVNEYSSSDYDFQICTSTTGDTSGDTSGSTGTSNCTESIRFGNLVLEERGNPTDPVWVNYTLVFLFGQYLLWILLTILALNYVKVKRPVQVSSSVGKSIGGGEEETAAATGRHEMTRVPENDEEAGGAGAGGVIGNEEEEEEMSIEIPFDPVTLAFQDLWYTVTLKGGEELDLLKGLSGYAEPGTMTALMGSSGAGKTTLLDVLSGRKNQGEISGLICVNGKILEMKKNSTSAAFRRVSGYVEQFDTLPSQSTAREAIEFSAALRLSSSSSSSSPSPSSSSSSGCLPENLRHAWVQSVLTTLELNEIQHHLIGSSAGAATGSGGGGGGMSFEQRKRISIGLELVANPSLLFLDEPTTGLDSRGAAIIIRCLQRVASTGRTIIATIHQPSTSLFNSFQNLFLLRRGGETVYFGPLGENCQSLINYFNEIPGVDPLLTGGGGGRHQKNPATWVLECIGAGTSGSDKTAVTDFHLHYKRSILCLTNETHVKVLCDPVVASLARQDDELAAATATAVAHGDSCLPTGLTILSPFLSLNIFQSSSSSVAAAAVAADDDTSTVYDDSLGNHEISYKDQFYLLLTRASVFYWRTPSYNFVRMVISLIVAFVFGLTCSDKQYTTDIEVISSASVVYMTLLFLGTSPPPPPS
jgi:ABC-type multidrug transport system ATPase subunit/ABC-type multidrug transport system permease subunit